ncbi:MAG: hypothetical protein VX423_00135 [Pseudomonadota bacterium]|nr:hypothetical protein [Pseudomonadota bacterium]
MHTKHILPLSPQKNALRACARQSAEMRIAGQLNFVTWLGFLHEVATS